MRSNEGIRKTIEMYGIRHWMVADKLGVPETTFSRKLRRELPPDEKAKIFAAIEQLKTEREQGAG